MKLIVLVAAAAALLMFSVSASSAQDSMQGLRDGKWAFGPPGCVNVWMYRSRQTRYAGAPRCRWVRV